MGCIGKRRIACGQMSDSDGEEDQSGSGWIASDRLVGEIIVSRGIARPNLMEASHKNHRTHIKVEMDAEKEEGEHIALYKYNFRASISTFLK